MSARVAPRLRHSVMTSSTNRRPTGRLIGPMTTRRPLRAPWKKPSCGLGARCAAEGGGLVGAQDEVAEVVFLLGEGCGFLLRGLAAADVEIGLSLVAAEVQNLEGAEVLLGAFFSRCTPISRLRVVWMANLPRSAAIHFRPSFSATAAVVPEPQKKSATKIARHCCRA